MGTRGTLTFVIDNQEKTSYNHSDSYPEGLGLDVLAWLRFAASDVANLRERVAALRVVDSNSSATPEDIERLMPYADLRVSSRDPSEWYVLLRQTQGNPGAILDAGVMEDGSRYGGVEWAYVVDLDAEALRVYEGDRETLAGEWAFDSLPADDDFVSAAESAVSA